MAIKSIRKEIQNLALVSVLAALLLTFVFNTFYKITKEREEAFTEFNTLAEITALNSQSALLFNDKQISTETLSALAPREEVLNAEIVTALGEILASKTFDRHGSNETHTHNASKKIANLIETFSGIAPIIKIEQPVILNDKLLGKVKLSIDTSLIWEEILLSLAASIGAMMLALLLSMLLVRRMIEHIMMPISRLSESASNIAITHQYNRRVEKIADDELGMMTEQFNLMLNEVEKRDQELSNQTNFLEDEVKNRTQTINKSMKEMQSLLDSMAEGAYGVDKQGHCTFVNLAFLRILGYAYASELIGKPIHELIQHSYLDGKPYPVTEGKVCDAYRHSLSIHKVNEVFWRKDQVPVPVEYWSQPVVIDDVVQGAIVTFIDITERNLSENNLRIAATAFESQEGMMITDASSIILRVNKAFTEITGFTTEDAVGKTPRILRSDRQNESFYAAMWARINHAGAWDGELWNKRKDGTVFPERLVITAVKNENGIVTNYVATLTDITLSRAAAAEIENLAFYDSLTQLPNRRLLFDRIKQALAYSTRNGKDGAVLFLDLDHFKTLNDTLGHDVGDMLLKQVAERLTASVREGDTVARLGGDEFVVLLEDLSELAIEAAEQAETIGEKILSALNQPYQLGKHEYQTTPSIGVVLFSNHGESQDSLLKHADIAMYQSKKLGRNRLSFFDPHMQDAINTRVDMERELRKALEKQQFQLYYQMQVNSLGQALGAEVLIRWIHPERGMISPFHFIPLAEDTELILPIGQWVLETACAQLKLWQQTEHTKALTLSVNVSAKQFRQADFVMQVQATLQRYAIDPSLLKLELTESMLLDDIEGIIATMTALKALGIRFSLDDFGTGYSSLQYLKKLPLYQLKIDQSFVRDIATDSSDRALVLTIITMAHSLDLNVIAEGVETEEQRQFLIENGCQDYQGYLFAKPMPITEFEVLLKVR
jgi:diguanylate cyclase (GGDEF)-like protein/PAS domain S-box-containing protein